MTMVKWQGRSRRQRHSSSKDSHNFLKLTLILSSYSSSTQVTLNYYRKPLLFSGLRKQSDHPHSFPPLFMYAPFTHSHNFYWEPTLMAESEEELKSLLMKVKEESEKVGLKLNIQETKIIASSPITSWQIDGETVETVADFIILGSKITAYGDCSHETKRRLLLGRKAMTFLDSILKCRDITLPTKVHLVKAMVFPVVMCGCEIWTKKKAEQRRIDAFELWCWRKLLRVPWTARKSNQSILKEFSLGCSLEGLMLKLKLQYLGHLIWRADSSEMTLMLGKTGDRRRRKQQRMRWLDGITIHGRLNGHDFR